MSITTKILVLLLSMAAILILPWLGGAIYYHGQFPSGFYAYPQLTAPPKKGFDLWIFIAIAFGCAVMAAVYLFPRLFGFKQLPAARVAEPKPRLPYWFWVGLIAWSAVMLLFAFKDEQPVWYIHWSDVPLFWGFTLVLDGWVYVRNGGKSLMSKVPQELMGIGMASVSGWMIFEFLNFFVDDNWYYPKGNILNPEEFLLYACIVSSGLMPLAFEWYCLFKTFPKLSTRFSNGPKIKFTPAMQTAALVVSLLGIFASSLFPDYLFFMLWVSPPIILTVVLHKIGVWTPLNPIDKGNWSPTLLSALTYLVTGFCLEGQNYLSAIHTSPPITQDPAYWQYSLPYVDVLHVFEMPLLGMFGYLPFGVYCWIWWIACATLLNIPARFLHEDPLNFEAPSA